MLDKQHNVRVVVGYYDNEYSCLILFLTSALL